MLLKRISLIFLISLLLLLPVAHAHAPLTSGEGGKLTSATFVPEPTKSWAIYSELHEAREAHYYRMEMKKGERIHISLFKPTDPLETDFLPGFVLFGPNLSALGAAPDFIEAPPGANAILVEGKMPPRATYEPFSPSSFYNLADLKLEAPATGTYYLAVFEPSSGGHYGLAIGDRESFTLSEWVLIPLNLISIYFWEGQSMAFIFAPAIAVLLIGIVLLIRRSRRESTPKSLFEWLGSISGLLFIATGAITLVQMISSLSQTGYVSEAFITIIFILIPVLLGFTAIRLSLKRGEKVTARVRVYFAIIGAAALFIWAGLYIGPALMIIASWLGDKRIISES